MSRYFVDGSDSKNNKVMRKQIDFPPYEEAEIKAIYEDGSVLCDLYGRKMEPAESLSEGIGEAGTGGMEPWQWHDTAICFPAGSAILSLTEPEKAAFEEEQKQKLRYDETAVC